MPEKRVPPDVRALADARVGARRAKDWPEADRLRGEIEAAGWTIVDTGLRYRLTPTHPADADEGGTVHYGRSSNVPSRLADAPSGIASVVLVASGWPGDVARAVGSVRHHAPADVQVVVVADGMPAVDEDALAELHPAEGDEIIRTSAPLGQAAALNCGIRRARSEVVVAMVPSVELTGDAVTPLARALDDPTIAIAGPFGIVSDDLRHFREAPAGDVDAIEAYLAAFRREDYTIRGPLDEHFRFYRNLDIWWSLVLRDEGPGAGPRRALAMGGLPLVRHEHRGWVSLPEEERDRLSRRNFYRLLDRFRDRRDLLLTGRSVEAPREGTR